MACARTAWVAPRLKILGITVRHYVDREDFAAALHEMSRAGNIRPLKVQDYPAAGLAIGDFGTLQLVGCQSLQHGELPGAQVVVRVDTMSELAEALIRLGNTVLHGPQECAEGLTMRVRHCDGMVVDYLQETV